VVNLLDVLQYRRLGPSTEEI